MLTISIIIQNWFELSQRWQELADKFNASEAAKKLGIPIDAYDIYHMVHLMRKKNAALRLLKKVVLARREKFLAKCIMLMENLSLKVLQRSLLQIGLWKML